MAAVAVEKPVRVQRKRVRGFRLPPNTVCVTRPGYFGNPFTAKEYGNLGAVWKYEKWLQDTLDGQLVMDRARKELRGRNLACFCPVGSSCHVDVLLKLANEEMPALAESEG
jgi:hypothetical protein